MGALWVAKGPTFFQAENVDPGQIFWTRRLDICCTHMPTCTLCKKLAQSSLVLPFPIIISNSYTMGCPPVRRDNPRALASGLSYVQVDNPWYNYFISPTSV